MTDTSNSVRAYDLVEITTDAGTRRVLMPPPGGLVEASPDDVVRYLIFRVYAEVQPQEGGRSVVTYRATDDYRLVSGYYRGEDEADGWDGSEQVLVQTSDAEALAAALLAEPHLDDHIRTLAQVCEGLRIHYQPVDQEPEYRLEITGLEYANPDGNGVNEERDDEEDALSTTVIARTQGMDLGLRATVFWEYGEALPPTADDIVGLIDDHMHDHAGQTVEGSEDIVWVAADFESNVEDASAHLDISECSVTVTIHTWGIQNLDV